MLLWVGVATLIFVIDGLLHYVVPHYWNRYYARNNIGPLSQISVLAMTEPDAADMVVVESWLVEGPLTMDLAAEKFDPRRASGRSDLIVRSGTEPMSIPHGGKLAYTRPAGDRRVRFQVTPTREGNGGYHYAVVAALESGSRVTQVAGRASVQPSERVEISATGEAAPGAPVYFELGSIAPGRKHTAVFVFHPLETGGAPRP
jgi:hypothetical protein